jgi:long-chain acyl-CoA synthetase
MPKGAMLTH